MTRGRVSTLAGVLLLLPLSLAGWAFEERRRDFAGQYALADVVAGQEFVQVTLNLRVQNFTGMFVNAATILIHSSNPDSTPYASIGPLAIQPAGHVVEGASLIVTLEDYQAWQAASAPHVWIDFWAPDGNRYRRFVELVQVPLIGAGE